MKKQAFLSIGILLALCLLSGVVVADTDKQSEKMHYGEWRGVGSHVEGLSPKRCDKHSKGSHKDKARYKSCDKQAKHHGENGVLEHREALGLSDEQVSNVKSLLRDTRKKSIALNAEIEISGIDLKALKHAADVDMVNLANMVKNIYAKKAESKIIWIQFKVDSKAILSDEQRAQLRDIYKQKHSGKRGPCNHS